jgi:tetratricopeptide (TPR) repeat protein
LSKSKQYDQAIKAYREVFLIQPEYADAWHNLGIVYIESGQYDQAIEAYREVVRINPINSEAWNNLGVAYFFQNQHDKVREVYLTLRTLNSAMADKYAGALMRKSDPDLPEINQLHKHRPQRLHRRHNMRARMDKGESEVMVTRFWGQV